MYKDKTYLTREGEKDCPMKKNNKNKCASIKSLNDMTVDASLVRNALLILRFAIIRLTLFLFIVVFLLFLDFELFVTCFSMICFVCFGNTF